MNTKRTIRRFGALALAASLAALLATGALAEGKSKLAEYAPANANLYFEIDDFDKLVEAAKGSVLRKVFETDELRPVVEMLDIQSASVEGTGLANFVAFDLKEAKKYAKGGVALFNSHRGLMSEIPGAEPIDGRKLEETLHTDGVIVFEHDGKHEKELLDLFKEAIEKIDANAERERDKVGSATVMTCRVNKQETVVRYEWNENAPEDAPIEEMLIVHEEQITVPLVMQYAVLGKVAYFGEGSNKPVSLAIAASQKKGGALDKAPGFKRFLDALEPAKDSKAQALLYIDLANALDQKDIEAKLRGGEPSDPVGLRDFSFAAARVNFVEKGVSADGYLGLVDSAAGPLASLLQYLTPVAPEAFDKVDASAMTASVLGLELGELLKRVEALVMEASPQLAMQKQFLVSQAQAIAGVDPFEDFLFLFGGKHYSIDYGPASDEWDPEEYFSAPHPLQGAGTLALGLSDGPRMAATLKTLVQKAGENFGAEMFATQRFAGADLHLLSAEPGSDPFLAIAATNDFLVVSESADHAKRAISSLGGGAEKPLARDKDFRRTFRKAPENAAALQYGRDIAMTPAQVSDLGGEFLSLVAEYELMDEEKMGEVFEKYQQQELNKHILRLGARQSGSLWKGANFLQARVDFAEFDADAKRSE